MRFRGRKSCRTLSAALAALGLATPVLAATTPVEGPIHILHTKSWHDQQQALQAAASPGNPSVNAPPLNLMYGSGPIMTSTTTYLIFWLPPGVHFSGTSDTDYENLLMRYFQDIGGSPFYNILTQYPGSNGAPANSSTLGGWIVDTNAYPKAGTTADPLLNQDLINEIDAVRQAQGWPTGVTTMYFIFTGSGIQSCKTSAHTDCSQTSYCAYHSYYTINGENVVYANMPDDYSLGDCDNFNVNGDAAADVEASIVSHEHFEAASDPELGAWRDSNGDEIGDKCAYNFGPGIDGSNTLPNLYLNGNPYRLQQEWSNAVSGCALSYCNNWVCSTAMTNKKTATPASIAGNPGDTITYKISYNNPSDVDPATVVSVIDALPPNMKWSGGQPYTSASGNQLTFDLSNVNVHGSGTITFLATPTAPLAAGDQLDNEATLYFSDSQGQAQGSVNSGAVTSVVNAPPSLSLPGNQTQDYHDALTFNITATDADAGDTLLLSASGLPTGLAFTDNGNRTGTVSGVIQAAPGTYSVTFTVNDQHNTPVSSSLNIVVTREETTLTYTGPTVIAQNLGVTLSSVLLEDGTAPIAGRTVTMTLGSGGGSQTCSATTDATGAAICTINPVTVAQGPQPITATFGGDAYYLPSTVSKQAILFAFPVRGDFALGDVTVASATPTTVVTWWSSQWSTLNVVSGGMAPSSFKGFANDITPTTPACGAAWTTSAGNSPPPVDNNVPSYMGVLVSSSITKSGTAISGNSPKIVVVKTNPGYAPDPSHPGTGTIVAQYCP